MGFKAAVLHILVIAGALMPLSAPFARAEPVSIVGFGDSLMAGYLLAADQAYPARLQAALKAAGHDVSVVNAGVSGDTTSGGLSRVDWSVPDGTDGVILELGANDALRGIAPEETEKNLDALVARLKARGIAVYLAGMMAPPNMGPEYASRFNPIYQRIAAKYSVPLYPLFNDAIVTESALKLEDGMHPNDKGVDAMVEKMLPSVTQFVESISTSTN